MNHLHRMIEALKFANPFCLVPRFDDGLAHCIEVSVCGAEVLRRQRIVARTLPCAVVVTGELGQGWSLGLNPRQLYALTRPNLPFEEWSRVRFASKPVDDHPIHMVIEAKHAGQRAIIDLTIGQLRSLGRAPVPLHLHAMVGVDGGWVELTGDGVVITYMDSPNTEHLPAEARDYHDPNYVDDLHRMMELALRCQLDRVRYLDELRRLNPEGVERCNERLSRWMAGP